jgi:hypothetical protein
MKAFWWFKDGAVAGMARPGFNAVHWFDLGFEEASLLGWLGKVTEDEVSLESLRHHLRTFTPRVFQFYGFDAEKGARELEALTEESGVRRALGRLAERTGILAGYELEGDRLRLEFSRERLDYEARILKERGVRRIVALTEHHHQRDLLEGRFELHHLAIDDLGAPRIDQVHALADVLRAAGERAETVAVHCLAGIGRTSTMLIGAHILMGEPADEVQARLKERNPLFVLTGPQADFVRSLRSDSPPRTRA